MQQLLARQRAEQGGEVAIHLPARQGRDGADQNCAGRLGPFQPAGGISNSIERPAPTIPTPQATANSDPTSGFAARLLRFYYQTTPLALLVCLLAPLAMALLATLVLVPQVHDWIWVVRTVLCFAALAVMISVVRQRQRASARGALELAMLIQEVHAQRSPIEVLWQIDGDTRPTARAVALVMQDLREMRQAHAALEDEMRQRVAGRTVALERTIGTLRQQASRDGLTGLYNRRMFDQVLPELVTQHVNQRRPLSMMMIDVDYFKQLNDTLGHAAGDQLLKALGELINSTIRSNDLGFRCGGDEFVVLLPGCTPEAADRLATRLQSLVSQLTATYKTALPPAISIGVACLDETAARTPQALTQLADERLYRAKARRPKIAR